MRIRPKVTRFHDACTLLLAEEGGFVNNPKDPGGATNMGITLATLARWRGQKVTVQDLRDLTETEARQIYFAFYWNVVAGDSLPAGLDLEVFDFGVNAGTARSVRALQAILVERVEPELEVDGVVGPRTLAAVALCHVPTVIEEFHRERMGHYRGLMGWDTFGKGWTARSARMLAQSRAWAGYRPAVGAA